MGFGSVKYRCQRLSQSQVGGAKGDERARFSSWAMGVAGKVPLATRFPS